MKPKTVFIILVAALLIIILIARRQSRTDNFISSPTPSAPYNQTIPTTGLSNASSIDDNLQSLDAIIGGINPQDFSPANLDGIE